MKRNYILLGLLLMGLLGCQKNNSNLELVINVDDEFKLDLWEDLESATPKFNFLIETIKEYNCSENAIKYTLSSGGNTFVIKLDQIDQKNDCIPGPAPASANVPLELAEKGSFNIRIKLKETIENTGILQITPKKISFELVDDVGGINLVRNELLRIPRGTIWGFVAYKNDADKSHADQFIEDIENHTAIANSDFTNGYYGYFSVNSNQDYLINDKDTPLTNVSHFVYNYTGNIDDLKTMAEGLSNRSNGNAVVKLFWFL